MFTNRQTTNTLRRNSAIIYSLAAMLFSSGFLFNITAQSRELTLADIIIALRSKKAVIEEKNRILAVAVKERGITFSLTPEIERELSGTGAYRELIDAIKARTAPPEPAASAKADPVLIASISSKPPPPPPDFDFYRIRANANVEKGDLDSAIVDLSRAIELKPKDGGTYLERALMLVTQGKFEASIPDFSKAIEFAPNAPAFLGRAAANEKIGSSEKALIDYQKAADLDPKSEPAKTAVARLNAEKAKAIAPPPIVETAKVLVPPVARPSMISVGSLTSYTSRLVTPSYSVLDKKMGLQGKITVEITLDEEGKLVSAKATEGPKSLRNSSEDAIKKTKFNPVMVGGKAVQATGFIVFNFVANR